MFIRMRYLICFLIFSQFFFSIANADGSLETEIKHLENIGIVSGSHIGLPPTPGYFFELSKIFIEKGTEEDFLKLAEDKNPGTRCMGLLCLAQQKKTVNILKKHITDTDVITYYPMGCVGSEISVGNFVRELLFNANHLGHGSSRLPLLSKDDLIGLDIEILSKDSTANFHGYSARIISNALKRKKVGLTLPVLKRYTPDLEIYQIIKAIGRLKVSPERRQYLVSCIKDDTLDDISRLAAASALTRDSSDEALSLIEGQRIYLNSIEKVNWGDRLIETMKNRILHEKYMEDVRELSWLRKEKLDDVIINALSNNHPLAFPDLTNINYLILVPLHNQVCDIVGDSLIEMSKNLEEFNQPWNTYSDTVYMLDFIMKVRKGSLVYDDVFTEARRIELEKNIKEAIYKHFEQNQIVGK